MKGDTTCPDVLVCSIYATNIVHIISTVDYNVKWTPIKKKCYSKIEKKTVDIKFHRLNIIHMYNFGMVSVNVAYQLLMQYRPDHWMRNRKWWCYIFIWGLRGALTNSYIIYRKKHQSKRNNMYRVPNDMSHLQLLESLPTHLMTFKNRKSQRLKNTSAVAAASGNKISNYMTLTSLDYRMSHQRTPEILDVRVTPISKNTLATKFSLRLDREYHPFME